MKPAKLTLAVLQAEKLPCEGCGGKCCTVAGFTPTELRVARLANGGSYPPGARVVSGLPIKSSMGGGMGSIVVSDDKGTCAFLVSGQCSIYEARPRVCRDYGRVPELPCMVLHPREAMQIGERFKKQMEGR